MTADQSPRAGDGKPDNGWIHPGLGHPARPFAEWLNSQRMNDVSQVFHEIMARYCAALAAAPAAAPAVLTDEAIAAKAERYSFLTLQPGVRRAFADGAAWARDFQAPATVAAADGRQP